MTDDFKWQMEEVVVIAKKILTWDYDSSNTYPLSNPSWLERR